MQTDIDLDQAQKGSFKQLFEFLRWIIKFSVSKYGEIFKDSIGTQFSLDQAFGKIRMKRANKKALSGE